jgi:hypothetical protein
MQNMKKLTVVITTIAVIGIFSMIACKKDKTTTPTNNTTTAACNGMNLCFKLDGISESHNSTWKILSTRYRVYWEETSGSNYKNIELDIYGTTTGTYNIVANPVAGQAGFQYYIDGSGEKNIQGQSGTVELTTVGGNDISGKFTVTAKDAAGKTYEITEGNFVAVPK